MKIYENIDAENKYELILKNDKNEEFRIHYGGADLYWSMSDYREDNVFVITEKDEKFYAALEKVFDVIRVCDNRHNSFLNDNCFEWLSEAYGLPEHAHKLVITKKKDGFI